MYNVGMESITLGEIASALIFIAGVITAGGVIAGFMSKRFGKVMTEQLKPLNEKIDLLTNSVDGVSMENCKNFLVSRISEMESGKKLDKVVEERFWENYDHYTELGGNSYIHTAVEKLKKEGKL